jgi:hypothetical protein
MLALDGDRALQHGRQHHRPVFGERKRQIPPAAVPRF